VLQALFDLHGAGTVKPVIYKRYSLDEVPVALTELGSRKTYGKLVITP
jgi:NADPH2:quinone reductase